MNALRNEIKNLGYKGLQIAKLVTGEHLDILAVSLEKGSVFPEHTSPREARLIVLEGSIEFGINGKKYELGQLQQFDFPPQVKHSVLALQNSKFLIIR